MRKRLEKFVAVLIASESYDDDEGVWRFSNGSMCSICTSAAAIIGREFGGVVCGYWAKDNRAADIGALLSEGHDFAVIVGRWLVDYWAFRVARVSPRAVLDLRLPRDKKLAQRLYGRQESWVAITP